MKTFKVHHNLGVVGYVQAEGFLKEETRLAFYANGKTVAEYPDVWVERVEELEQLPEALLLARCLGAA